MSGLPEGVWRIGVLTNGRGEPVQSEAVVYLPDEGFIDIRDTEAADDIARVIAAVPEMIAALKAANTFIRNGIALGFIRMPDPGTPDPAHLTPGLVSDALAKAEGRS